MAVGVDPVSKGPGNAGEVGAWQWAHAAEPALDRNHGAAGRVVWGVLDRSSFGMGYQGLFGCQELQSGMQRSKRSLLLIVPSKVARMESNVLINGSHLEAHRIMTSLHQPIWWDKRFFASAAALSAVGTASIASTRRKTHP